MTGYFFKTLWAHLRRGRSLYLLTMMGVALGVASVLSIQILNRNALSAFSGSVQAVSGEADLTIMGRTPVLDETLFPRALAVEGVESAWPLYRLDVALEGREAYYLEIVGVDLFAPIRAPVTRWAELGSETASPAAILGDRGWAAIAPALAEEMGWAVGDTFTVSSGSRRAVLHVGTLVDFQRYTPLATRRIAVMDIAQAQGLLGRPGEIHQIDLHLVAGADRDTVAKRLAVLDPSIQVLTPEQRQQEAQQLLGAFRLNLTALSLISLFVGVFLVYSSTQAALVRKRAEFGLLRSLGAGHLQVFLLILAEVTLLGALGVALGLPLGYWAASANVSTVSATLSNVYLLEAIERLELPIQLYVLAGLVGIGGAWLGALLPALELSRKDTHSLLSSFTLQERTRGAAGRLALAALILSVAVGIWFALAGRDLRIGGFVLGFVLLLDIPLVTPLFIRLVGGRLRARSLGAVYSLKNLTLRLQTSSVAVAALGIAVSMLIGVTMLIGSFRQTLDVWVRDTIRADIYITTESWARSGRDAVMEDSLVQDLSDTPGVAGVETLRQFSVQSRGRPILLNGIGFGLSDGFYHLPMMKGDLMEALEAIRTSDVTVISEPLARKQDLALGDSLILSTPGGEAALTIVGIAYDYTTEKGVAYINQTTMARLYGPGPVNNVALYLQPGVDGESLVGRLKSEFRDTPLLIRSNRELRAEILRIFDQTFAITRILQVMALIVAASGIALTLLILARERAAEFSLYRCLGAASGQVSRIFLGEGLGMAVLGMVLGMIGGFGLALILTFVINRAYFGWTIQLALVWPDLLLQAGLILSAALAAGVYPALRVGRTPMEGLSREVL